MNDSDMYLKSSEDKLKISIKRTELNPDEIYRFLKQRKIKGIINKEVIEGLSEKKDDQLPDDEIVIVEAPATLRAECNFINNIETLSDWEQLFPYFKRAHHDISIIRKTNNIPEYNGSKTFFVRSGEKFLTIKKSEIPEDIYGKKISPENIRSIIFNPKTIKEDNLLNIIIYSAKTSGYLVIEDNSFTIVHPIYDLDKFDRFFIFYPGFKQDNNIKDYFWEMVNYHKAKYPSGTTKIPDVLSEKEINTYSSPFIKKICQGNRPLEGSDAELKILVKENNTENVKDQKDIKHYIVVSKDEIIAEKIFKVDGINGCDIYGNIIEVKEGKDINLNINELIYEETLENKIQYKALTDGVLNIKNNSLHVTEALIIPGNVDYSTGNIEYKKDVYVEKDIKPGFRVNSGGNLIIKGSVEEGALLQIGGDLTVEGGVIGKKTKVFAEGNAEVKFIQDAEVYISGKLIIKTSLIGGIIYAHKGLVVINRQGSRKSQVFGGEYYTFYKMALPSVGSPYHITKLSCGFNPRIETLLETVEQTLKSLELQISGLHNRIGFNIKDPATIERIKRLPADKKEILIEKLNDLKEITTKYNDFQIRKENMLKKLYSEKPESLEIEINSKLIPDTLIQFIQKSHMIKNDYSTCKITFIDNEIEIIEAK